MQTSDASQRIENIRIGEIMIPIEDYPKVAPGAKISDAMAIMEGSALAVGGRTSLPRVVLVIDRAGKLQGTVRRRDIMRGLEPQFLSNKPLTHRKQLFEIDVDPNLASFSADHIVSGVREQAEKPVSSISRPIDVYLNAEDNIIKGLYEMVDHGLTLIPVVKQGSVVGVVRTVELMHELSRIVLPPEQVCPDPAAQE